jgi:hypothetical protein
MVDPLSERGKALVDRFFAERDRQLVDALQAKATTAENAAELKQATGIQDDAVISALSALGLSGDTLAALSIVPMLAIAWSDRVLDEAERAAVLLECVDMGLREGSESHAMISGWLKSSPDDALVEAWSHYWAALKPVLGAAEAARLREDVLERARRVARASGGLLGIGATSGAERQGLAWLESVL